MKWFGRKLRLQFILKKTGFKLSRVAWFPMAASITILLGFFMYNRSFHNESKLMYSTEKLDTRLNLASDDDAEKQYQMINDYCKSNSLTCQNQKFHALKSKLDDLSESSYKLKNAIGQYNTDSQLITQLTAIEQKRAEILRKMATYI